MAGKKPKVPDVPQISLQEEQAKSIGANLSNFDEAAKLAGKTNQFNQDALMKQLRQAIPGFDSMMTKGGSVIDSLLSGEVPKDVQEAIKRASAYQSQSGGFGGSQASRNLTARDLGLTSLDLTGKGIDSALRWITSARQNTTAPMMDVTSMFITPWQQYQTTLENRNTTLSRDWLGAQIAAMPDPQSAAIGGAIIKTDDQMMSMASSFLGAAGGKLMCWVAREVYGHENPKWLQFRNWMLNFAPFDLLALYLERGERFAEFISDKPELKNRVRAYMDSKIT